MIAGVSTTSSSTGRRYLPPGSTIALLGPHKLQYILHITRLASQLLLPNARIHIYVRAILAMQGPILANRLSAGRLPCRRSVPCLTGAVLGTWVPKSLPGVSVHTEPASLSQLVGIVSTEKRIRPPVIPDALYQFHHPTLTLPHLQLT